MLEVTPEQAKKNNETSAKREKIIFGYKQDWNKSFGGTIPFKGLSLDQLKELFSQELIEPDGAQNYSPTNQEFFNFIKANPRFTCHGYLVAPDRSDCRVSIEGVALVHSPTAEEKKNFIVMFRQADDFVLDGDDIGLFCWYD